MSALRVVPVLRTKCETAGIAAGAPGRGLLTEEGSSPRGETDLWLPTVKTGFCKRKIQTPETGKETHRGESSTFLASFFKK